MNNIQLKEASYGVDILVPYLTELGTERKICIWVTKEGINISATSTLNAAGQQALEDGLQLAKLLLKYNKIEYV